MTLRSVTRPLPNGLAVVALVAILVALVNYASGVYGGAIVAGLGAIVAILLGVLS